MAIELEVRVNKEWPWMIQFIVNRVELVADFDTRTGKVHFWGSRHIEDYQQVINKIRELSENKS